MSAYVTLLCNKIISALIFIFTIAIIIVLFAIIHQIFFDVKKYVLHSAMQHHITVNSTPLNHIIIIMLHIYILIEYSQYILNFNSIYKFRNKWNLLLFESLTFSICNHCIKCIGVIHYDIDRTARCNREWHFRIWMYRKKLSVTFTSYFARCFKNASVWIFKHFEHITNLEVVICKTSSEGNILFTRNVIRIETDVQFVYDTKQLCTK